MIDSNKKLYEWGPIDSALLPLSYFFAAMYDRMFDLFNLCWSESAIIFEKDSALWFLEQEALDKACQEFTDKVFISDKTRGNFYKTWHRYIKKLLNIHKSIERHNLKKLGDKELAQLFRKWNKAYLDFWSIGVTTELINFDLDVKLKKIIERYLKDKKSFNKAFVALSTPSELSFYKEEEIDLMPIIFLSGKEKEKALEKHAKKYFWILDNYLEAQVLGKDYFKDHIKGISKNQVKKSLKETSYYKQKVSQAKQEYIGRLKLSQKEVKIVDLLSDSIILQDKRKKYNLQAAHFLEEFLKELSRRNKIFVRDLKRLLPDEIERYFQRKDLQNLIKERKNIIVVSCAKGMQEIIIGKKAIEISEKLRKKDVEKKANLQGTVASTGKTKYFRGVARIILTPKEGHKLRDGEILVTAMTTPDYVVFMKKAGAIITDIGGITCHAAVVSREFQIPCIVNTKDATKIIKDGDILELHNLRGGG